VEHGYDRAVLEQGKLKTGFKQSFGENIRYRVVEMSDAHNSFGNKNFSK